MFFPFSLTFAVHFMLIHGFWCQKLRYVIMIMYTRFIYCSNLMKPVPLFGFSCSVLLSILSPHVALPPGIDIQRSSMEKGVIADTMTTPDAESIRNFGTTAEEASGKSNPKRAGGESPGFE